MMGGVGEEPGRLCWALPFLCHAVMLGLALLCITLLYWALPFCVSHSFLYRYQP